mmetsp:Transcript_81517/g.99931  ORF Transcript_81517/g.99931 Transcript_81517/m.99931 type:complete len:256 (+) Transcript_81517:18-785(+)
MSEVVVQVTVYESNNQSGCDEDAECCLCMIKFLLFLGLACFPIYGITSNNTYFMSSESGTIYYTTNMGSVQSTYKGSIFSIEIDCFDTQYCSGEEWDYDTCLCECLNGHRFDANVNKHQISSKSNRIYWMVYFILSIICSIFWGIFIIVMFYWLSKQIIIISSLGILFNIIAFMMFLIPNLVNKNVHSNPSILSHYFQSIHDILQNCSYGPITNIIVDANIPVSVIVCYFGMIFLELLYVIGIYKRNNDNEYSSF